mmetsp:Transcript_1187/g.2368  ORF Transcript_1187/g.2368 Transcript_1187/m.2368 type:complete len:95 (+) Transcript_1187:1604-1888(+)
MSQGAGSAAEAEQINARFNVVLECTDLNSREDLEREFSRERERELKNRPCILSVRERSRPTALHDKTERLLLVKDAPPEFRSLKDLGITVWNGD